MVAMEKKRRAGRRREGKGREGREDNIGGVTGLCISVYFWGGRKQLRILEGEGCLVPMVCLVGDI